MTHIIYITPIIYISYGKVNFLKHIKTYFFLYIRMTNNGYQKKRKKSFRKKHVKGTKIFLKKKKTKCSNMLVSGIETF